MTTLSWDVPFGPGHHEWCPEAPGDDLGHCQHWYDAEPCCRCGTDEGDKGDVDDDDSVSIPPTSVQVPQHGHEADHER